VFDTYYGWTVEKESASGRLAEIACWNKVGHFAPHGKEQRASSGL
jgi:hypothetical protein